MYSLNTRAVLSIFACMILICGAITDADAALTINKNEIGKWVDVEFQYADLDRTVISYDISGFDTETILINGSLHKVLSLNPSACMDYSNIGHPTIPELSSSLMIPDTALMKANVLSSNYYEISNFNLAPWRGSIKRTIDPSTVPYRFGKEYKTNAFFPSEIVNLRDPFIMHDIRGLVAEVHPFQYNPVTKVLRVYTSVVIEVVNSGTGVVNTLDRNSLGYKPSVEFENLYKGHFANYTNNRTSRALPSEHGDMLIISHGNFIPNMQTFVNWKNSIGITTTIVDVASIGNTSNAIKAYIKTVYNSSNLSYVLIVGDHAQVKSPIPSYSSQDPIYSLMDSDNYPDLFIGRFSAETKAEVDTQVERALDYEKAPHDVTMNDWNAKAMGVASDEGAGIGAYGLGDWEHLGLLRKCLMLYGYSTVDEVYEPSAKKSMITAGVEDGRQFINYCGHGGPTGWGTTGYSNSDVAKLKNTVALPVINSVACNTGQFHNYFCFGEAWTRHTFNGKPSGGLIFQGSSISMSWAPPMYGQCNHGVGNQFGFMDNLYMENYETFGGCFNAGMITMMQVAGSSGVNEFKHWHYFGDPSLRIGGAPGLKNLSTDNWRVSLDTPDDYKLNIDLGLNYAGYKYLLVGGISNTQPGTTFPGGVILPINMDLFTNVVFANLNSPVFQNFSGKLDSMGKAIPILSTNGLTPLDRNFHGFKTYFAAIVWPAGSAFEKTTNAKLLTLIDKMPTP